MKKHNETKIMTEACRERTVKLIEIYKLEVSELENKLLNNGGNFTEKSKEDIIKEINECVKTIAELYLTLKNATIIKNERVGNKVCTGHIIDVDLENIDNQKTKNLKFILSTDTADVEDKELTALGVMPRRVSLDSPLAASLYNPAEPDKAKAVGDTSEYKTDSNMHFKVMVKGVYTPVEFKQLCHQKEDAKVRER